MKRVSLTYARKYLTECVHDAEKAPIAIDSRVSKNMVLMSEEDYLRLSLAYNGDPEAKQRYENTGEYSSHKEEPPTLDRRAMTEDTTEIASNGRGCISSKGRVVRNEHCDENNDDHLMYYSCSRCHDVSNISHKSTDVNTILTELNEIKLLLHYMIHSVNSNEFTRESVNPTPSFVHLSSTNKQKSRSRGPDTPRGACGSDAPCAGAREHPQEEYTTQKKMLSRKKFVPKLKKNIPVTNTSHTVEENNNRYETEIKTAYAVDTYRSSPSDPVSVVNSVYANKSPLTDRVCSVFSGYSVSRSEDIFILDHFISSSPDFQIEDALMALSSIQTKGYHPRQWTSVIGWLRSQMTWRLQKANSSSSSSSSLSSVSISKPTLLTPEGRRDGDIIIGNDGGEYVFLSSSHSKYNEVLEILNRESWRDTKDDPWKLGYTFMSKETALRLVKHPDIKLVLNG